MCVQLVSAVTIIAKSLPASLFVVIAGTYEFGYTAESTKEIGYFGRKIDQQIPASVLRFAPATDQNRLACVRPVAVRNDTVRQKAALREGPQQLIETRIIGIRPGVDQYFVLLSNRLLSDSAGGRQPCIVTGSIQNIEIDPGHDTW
jgi:hypothetical protein